MDAFESYGIYRGMRMPLMIQVTDLEAPCTQIGEVKVRGTNCQVEELGNGRFSLYADNDGAFVEVFYETPNAVIDMGTIPLELIEPDFNDPDVQAIYPDPVVRDPLANPMQFSPSKEVIPNTHYALDQPAPSTQKLSLDKVNRLRVRYLEGCNARRNIQLEVEGMDVQKLDKWNEFLLSSTENRKATQVKVFAVEDGKRTLLDEVNFDISE